MFWKELINQSEEFLQDPNNIRHFSLKDHPEFPYISELEEEEVLELLKEFLSSENQKLSIANMMSYAPVLEIMLIKKNLPSIFG
ncbi:hypothetical protein [Leptospira ilyithenensis]|uniref:Uncharacterized protein n=1 Tax=Leptospira ilyithenensis TaxID=2484901 RepID=A0A4R9LUS8_9LEPT|nr:hypothetical protein [Leptospira ilyithenensis]TGN14544.1 hypothetical protein EHS11_00695 [Leptospira ilyithenensis]